MKTKQRPRRRRRARERSKADLAYELARAKIGREGPNLCLYWAAAAVEVLREMSGRDRVQIQAGTASWRIVPPNLDDGVSPDRFAYQFNAENAACRMVDGQLHLPEMHCWAADPDTGEIIDMSLGSQPEQCRLLTGLEWRTPRPAYFWGDADQCQRARHIYRPDHQAIEIAYQALAMPGDSISVPFSLLED